MIATEGQSGVGFFVIAEGTVAYDVGGVEKGTGGPGDLLRRGRADRRRAAHGDRDDDEPDVTAYGLTSWEFRPLVEENASIAWELLQGMAKRLRAMYAET